MNGAWTLPVGAVALFGALLLIGMELARPRVRRRRLASELGIVPRETTRTRLAALGTQATAIAERALTKHDREGKLGFTLERAGIDLRPAEFAAVVASVVIATTLAGLLFMGPVIGLLLGGATVGVFWAIVSMRAQKRRERFVEQLGDTLQMLAGGLRAGHSLTQAMDAVVHEAESPTREEFQRVMFETQLGHPLPNAMRSLADRVGSEDFEWVAEAVEIQRDIGGDLAELLDNVTGTIRDRRRVSRQIKSLTAEGRLSAIILFCLPIFMLGFMAFANKTYFKTLRDSLAGNLMLAGAAGLMVVGGLWLRRIVRMLY
jgi:tight adherence protein B